MKKNKYVKIRNKVNYIEQLAGDCFDACQKFRTLIFKGHLLFIVADVYLLYVVQFSFVTLEMLALC